MSFLEAIPTSSLIYPVDDEPQRSRGVIPDASLHCQLWNFICFFVFFYCTRKPLVQVMWWNYFLMPVSCREWGSRNCPRALSWSMMGFLFREGGSWQQSLSGINNTHTYRSMCVSTYNTTHSLRRRINTSNIFLQWSNCELKYNKCLLYVCVCTTRQRQHYELVKQR